MALVALVFFIVSKILKVDNKYSKYLSIIDSSFGVGLLFIIVGMLINFLMGLGDKTITILLILASLCIVAGFIYIVVVSLFTFKETISSSNEKDKATIYTIVFFLCLYIILLVTGYLILKDSISNSSLSSFNFLSNLFDD